MRVPPPLRSNFQPLFIFTSSVCERGGGQRAEEKKPPVWLRALTVVQKVFKPALNLGTWGVRRTWRADKREKREWEANKKQNKTKERYRRLWAHAFRFSRMLQSAPAIGPFDKAPLMGCGKAFYHWAMVACMGAVNLR